MSMVVGVGSMLAVELAFVLVVERDFRADSIELLLLRFNSSSTFSSDYSNDKNHQTCRITLSKLI